VVSTKNLPSIIKNELNRLVCDTELMCGWCGFSGRAERGHSVKVVPRGTLGQGQVRVPRADEIICRVAPERRGG